MTTKLTLQLDENDVVYHTSMASPKVRVHRVEETRADRVGERAFYVHGVVVDTGEPHVWWCTDQATFLVVTD